MWKGNKSLKTSKHKSSKCIRPNPIRLAEKAIEDYHMYHLDTTRRAATHLYSYLHGWIDGTDIERIIEPFIQTHTRHKLKLLLCPLPLKCTQTLRSKDVTYTLLVWHCFQFKKYTEPVDEGMYNHIRCDEWELVAKNAEELCVYFNELRTFPKKYADIVQDTILEPGRLANQVDTLAIGLVPETADTGDDVDDADEEDDDVGFQRYEDDED
ncbi:hypothetical protein CBER1_11421 [Cercospora berteroae]|uniref:Uncharacterized protein n=1 Tax=Cercospora berteroae TaxID=357750 RepID=A0A2S6BYV1_9PEZI|nr:hypothetical protein CBER1_11421 [Cercospora berteroae]